MDIHVHIHRDHLESHGPLRTLAAWATILTLVVTVVTLAWMVFSAPTVVKVELPPTDCAASRSPSDVGRASSHHQNAVVSRCVDVGLRQGRSTAALNRERGEAATSGPLASVSASVCAATWPDRENVDHPLGVTTIEDHPPLADAQPPQALGTTQQLDVSLRQHPDRGADPLPVPTAKPSQRLQCGWADLDPPSMGLSQRSTPPRSQTKGRRARFAPAEWRADPPR
jgi:hypothetical protein